MSKPTLAKFFADVEARCGRATKSPWGYASCLSQGGLFLGIIIEDAERRDVLSPTCLSESQVRANAHLAASARTDLEALLKMVKLFFWAIQPMPLSGTPSDAHEILKDIEALVPEEEP